MCLATSPISSSMLSLLHLSGPQKDAADAVPGAVEAWLRPSLAVFLFFSDMTPSRYVADADLT
jgi:hypothetical protein